MNVKMVYHTPELHKLVEAIARVCYQSYDKLSPTSHTMVKSIMRKNHLSIASSGNMVFEVSLDDCYLDDVIEMLDSLVTFKQINNFIRWTTPAHKEARTGVVTISMNMLTLLDIIGDISDYNTPPTLLDAIMDETDKIPYLKWFYDASTEVPPSDSPYIGSPELGSPIVLTEDYTSLKALGFTDYELDTHATITVDLITDRATGLQMWRHGDMTGGCELSQRYCDRSTAVIRDMVDIAEYPEKLAAYAELEGLTMDEAKEHYDAVRYSIRGYLEETVDFYTDVNNTLKELGVSAKRSKEIARSVLPNAVTTRIIQCRPLRQWKHFIGLRDSVHAQPEIYADTQTLKAAFEGAGIRYEQV